MESSPRVHARVAGALYLVIIVFGITSEVFIRAKLVVYDNAAATVANLQASGALFRAGFAADAIMVFCDVAIAVLFYQIFKPVGQTPALMAAAFRLTQAAILGVNLLNYYAPMLLVDHAAYMSDFETGQIDALVLFFLDLHRHGYDLALLFFGLSNLALGYLVVKSESFPAVLGYGLQAAAVVYLAGSFTRFLFPHFVSSMAPAYVIPLVAELAFCLWLLVKGINARS